MFIEQKVSQNRGRLLARVHSDSGCYYEKQREHDADGSGLRSKLVQSNSHRRKRVARCCRESNDHSRGRE